MNTETNAYEGAASGQEAAQTEIKKQKNDTTNSTKSTTTNQVTPFEADDTGVYSIEGNNSKRRICGPLKILAFTRDESGLDWGRLLEFKDPDGKIRRWTMPAQMLKGDGSEYRGILLAQGFDIAGKSMHEKLSEYIRSQQPIARVTCVSKTGWYKGVFVLPEQTIGKSSTSEEIVYQVNYAATTQLKQVGTYEDWVARIGTQCTGQHRLIYMISAAISAPILELIGAESSGVHYVGGSSVGKSTGIKLATSFFSSPDYNLTWNSTNVGLEGNASSRCDLPLVLDEIGQADGALVGQAIYTLCNGSGKGRGNIHGDARKSKLLRNRILSSGEVEVSSHITSSGKTSRAGHSVRLVNIPANAEKGFGILDFVPTGFDTAGDFIDYLNEQAKTVYGGPGLELIRKLAAERDKAAGNIRRGQELWLAKNLPKGATEQVARVAKQFAITAAAGELATELGLTGWTKTESFAAAKVCFEAWLANRSSNEPEEDAQAVKAVRNFIESNQFTRFIPWAVDQRKDKNIYGGFVGYVDGDARFLLTPGGFEEACKGFAVKVVSDALTRKGMLESDPDGKTSRAVYEPEKKKTKRFYVIPSKILES
ncbi:MAG TPA: DUF927 domain-containing protein [Oculatellaceae cyanobacterium]